jgi:hypothetical protein
MLCFDSILKDWGRIRQECHVMKRVLFASSFLVVLAVAQQSSAPQRNGGGAPLNKSTQAATPRAAAIGNNIVQVIDSLVAAGAAKGKGEFETTRDFDSRIKALSSRYGQLVFLASDETTASFEYDADAGEMTVALSAYAEFDGSENYDIRVFRLSGLVRNASYIDKNPYGIKTATRKKNYFQYGVRIGIDSPVLAAMNRDDNTAVAVYKFTFPCEAASARTIKPYLRAVVIGSMVEARVYQSSEPLDLFSAVSQEELNVLYVPFLVREIRVVDIRSGKLIAERHQ